MSEVWRYDLTQYAFFRRILKSRAFQPTLQFFNFLIFLLVIVSGLVGVGLGARNFAIPITWILWWVLLWALLIPFLGRAWCLMCPIVYPAELVQRRFWRRSGKDFTLNLRWPRILTNGWLQTGLLLVVAVFLVVDVTQPFDTAILVTLLMGGAVVASITFPRRTFCRYICPIGGLIGTCSTFAPTEVRIKDQDICIHGRRVGEDVRKCKKECYTGSDLGYGCPWFEFPQTKLTNANCGLCMECIRTCPNDNIAFNVRPFGQDLTVPGARRTDEAFRSSVVLGMVVFFSAALLGPWSWIKGWGNFVSPTYGVGLAENLTFALIVVGVTAVVFPGAVLTSAWVSKKLSGNAQLSVKKLFTDYGYAIIPLGIMFWIAFGLSLLLVNWSYILVVISDPFGFGWNLFGTRDISWTPIAWILPFTIVTLSILGMALSLDSGSRIIRQILPNSRQASRAFIPFATFVIVLTLLYQSLFL